MKRVAAAVIAVCLCVTLAGCDLWLHGSYSSVTPHREDSDRTADSNTEVSSYTQLRNKLAELVSTGSEGAVLYYKGAEPNVIEQYMETAIRYLIHTDPIGAYAVESVTYEIGTNAGRQAVAINISYVHSRSEILRISYLDTMEDAVAETRKALQQCNASIVFRINDYQEVDFVQLVQDYVEENPDLCMEIPQVAVAVYPESGRMRVVELNFLYQTSRESLRQMQQSVEKVFESAELYVTGDADVWQKYYQLYSFLMERHNYTVETSITASYSLLQHGVGDSKAFATVYAAMCRRAGLDCRVVSGTRSGEAWYWNVILDQGEYKYLDLLRCSQNGTFRVRTAEEMSGYVWDYSQYQNADSEQP